LGTPIRIQGRTIGFLNLDSREPNFFTEADGERLEAFAAQAAIAIDNARLYEEIRAYTMELEDRVADRTRALRAAVDHVEAILANSSDAILILSADGRIVQANPAFYGMFGFDVQELAQPSIQSLTVPEHVEALTNAMTAALESNESQRVEVMALRAGDSPFYADVAFADISQGEDTRILCSLHDISNLKRAENELISALNKEKELNELKTRFISMVSHEFRTPLASIRLSTDLLDQYSARMTDERRSEHLHKIQAQITHLTNLMEDVLTIGRADSGPTAPTLAPVDVDALFRALISDEQQTCFATHRLNYHLDGECGTPLTDEKLLRQIIQNLLSNAVKYSPDGGNIDCTLICREGHMVITVTDHGIGIPDEDQPRLFEVFFRASNTGEISGTGLGISIALRAAQALDGQITFTSKQGEGTTFTVTLPC
jgi:PAS domain S-box-containing protein